jgi:hypothetical protein
MCDRPRPKTAKAIDHADDHADDHATLTATSSTKTMMHATWKRM